MLKSFQKVEQTTKQIEINKFNGKSVENYFAGILTPLLNSKVVWASRTEDDAKVDIVTIISHPFIENTIEIVATQIKSGKTYAEVIDDKLIVKVKKFQELLNRSITTMVCWSEANDSNPYWFIIKSNSKYLKEVFNNTHVLCPATKFDIIRILYSSKNKNGGRGLIFSIKNRDFIYSNTDFLNLRKRAKNQYRNISKEILLNPCFGKIEFTRIGWRHITRSSRWNIYMIASFEIIPILDKILRSSPTEHYIFRTEFNKSTETTLREIEYLLRYSDVELFNISTQTKSKVTVYIKLIELCAYRTNWTKNANDYKECKRRVIFKSVYYK